MAPTTKPKHDRKPHYFAQWRKKAGFNQADLETKLGWSQSKASRIEGLESPFNQDDLERAAELFGVDVVDLLKTDPDDESSLWAVLVRLANAPDEIKAQVRAYAAFLLDGSSKKQ